MNFFNKKATQLTIAFSLLCASQIAEAANASKDIAVAIEFDNTVSRTISNCVDTGDATQYAKNQSNALNSNALYFIDRNRSETYHTTLDFYTIPSNRLNDFRNVVGNTFNNIKAYDAECYELRLFVHFYDKTTRTTTHEQFTYGAKQNTRSVDDLHTNNKEITYANLVFKIGTRERLPNDWKNFSNNLAQNRGNQFVRKSNFDLETHITIATINKYNKQHCDVVQDRSTGKFNVKPKIRHIFCRMVNAKVIVLVLLKI